MKSYIGKLVFEPISEEYLELIRTWRNSAEVSMYMYSEKLITKEEQISWYNNIINKQNSKYYIIKLSEKPIGLISFTEINFLFSSCFWAFYLGEIDSRGSGIGAKIEYWAIKYAFETLGLNKLRCEVFSFNEKVIKLHEKFGFVKEAYFREHCFKNGEFLDVVGLGLLKKDWESKDALMYKIIFRNET